MSRELEPNTGLSHYRIVSKIGEGGMGEVYLAQDTRLDRKVALKILPADVASNRDRMERFVREAKSAAALNHPNIAHIYEIGESDGTHYIAMEFIDGETLRHKINRDKAPLSKLLKYLIQVAQGLSKAHAAGIVHRDLKPDNIMITRDDYAKVLDFGLAKLVEPQRTFGPNESGSSEIATAVMQQPGWDSGHSTPGMVIGTIGYMSPEQASGRVDEIDLRSDIFSFGCILFEAATGQRAFAGKDVLDSLHKIVHAPTPQLKDVNPRAPAELQRIVRRCLAKEREKRYQSIKELAIELDDLQQELKGLTESEYSGHSAPVTSSSAAPASSAPSLASSETLAEEGFRVAVLPFKFSGSNVDVATLAEGLSEEIVTGLSRFSYLRVISRSSTLRYANETDDVRSVGRTLGARYVMEGSLRVAGASSLRVSVQLIDASTGAHVWAETYDRQFRAEEIFALQDELVPKIVATAADRHGVLPHTMSETLRNRDINDLRPYELVLRGFTYYERATAAEHPLLRTALERAVEQEPGNGDCWAILAILYCDEYKFGLNPLPDSLGRALAAAQKAVEVAVSNSFAYDALAQAHFFRREFESFRNAAARAIALNPLDGATTAWMGTLIAYSGDWDHGCDIVQRAMQLNPHHPGWYWGAAFFDAYRKGDYRAALSIALKYNLPGLHYQHWMLAIAYGQLGEREAANKSLQDLLALQPDFATEVREESGKWFNPQLVEHGIDGLRKAGLEIADETHSSTSSTTRILSGAAPADEGFWITVLPFKFTGSNTEVATLAEGLSEGIVTGLSRFSYLRVISRSSTLRYGSQTDDVRALGKTIGARYVMEGSLRLAGSSLRVSVQLVDSITGAHLWAETYNRQFRAEEIFALQDDLVPRIVSTVADINGVLPRSMSDAVCSRSPDALTPYEAVLRSFRYFDRVTAEELTSARFCLELAVEKAPNYADGWAMLALLCVQDYAQGFNLQSDSLTRGTTAARRAVEAAPSNHLAHFSLAQAQFFQKELQSFRNAAERAVALNPMDGNSLAFIGELLTYVGDWERGLALATRAKELNPNHPGWFWYADFFHAYRQGDYRGALDLILKTNLPGHWGMHAGIAAAAGQLGDHETAGKAIRDLLKLRPDYCATIHDTLAKWFDPELSVHLIDGLRKAGLKVADEIREPPDNANVNASTAFPSFESRPAIAVLPFENLSNDPEQEYFADGLAEELLNALAKINDLKVAARTSAFSFKGKNVNVREIGERLGVENVLEGSVRKSGNRLRITVQLVNASDGFHLWSERYDREMQDIFELQDEITLSITDALKVRLLGKDRDVVLKRYTDDAEAYELFLKGRYYHYKYSAEGWRRAIEFFEKAIEKEPNYAPAYAGLNTSLGFLWFLGFLPAEQAVPKMKAAAIRALEIDENLAEAHLSQAMISFFYDWEWQKAEQEFKRAIALDPHNAEALSFYSMFLGFEERFDEAIEQGERALAVDPLSSLINMNVGWTYFSAALFDKTLDQVGKMIEVEPDFYGCYWLRGAIYLSEGEYDKAVNELKKAVLLGGRQIVLADLGGAYGLAGKNDEATVILGQLLEMRQREYVPAICMTRIYSRIGENDKAIDWLEKAFEEKNGGMVFLKGEIDGAAQGDSLNSLGNDPRVIHLLRKMNLP